MRFLGQARELPFPPAVTAPAVVPLDCSMAAQTAAARRRASTAHARVNQPSWSITSVTARGAPHRAHDAFGRCLGRRPVEGRGGRHAVASRGCRPGVGHAGARPAGARDAPSSATRDDLRRLAMWLTVEEPQLRAVIDEALDTVQAVASGASGPRRRGRRSVTKRRLSRCSRSGTDCRRFSTASSICVHRS